MISRKLMFVMLLGFAVAAVGCQPKPNRDRSRIGRTARGPIGQTPNGNPAAFQPSTQGTSWGEVTGIAGDRAFQDELFYFTAPMLNGAPQEDQLGYVASTSGQATGVVFWGEASVHGGANPMYGGNLTSGQLDGQRARLHIEIYDDKTGLQRSDGSVRPQIVVHIGADQQGFVSAQGSIQGNQVNLIFTDQMGSVILQGSLMGQYFTGTMLYTNSQTGGQARQLGRFQVPACGFFICN